MRPNSSDVYMQLAGFYNRQGEFEKTMQALDDRASKEPTNPEAFHTIAAYYWEKAYRDFRLKDAEKMKYIELGLAADGQGAAAEARLHRRADLQEPPAPVQGARRSRTRPSSRRCSPKPTSSATRAIELRKKKAGGQ